jgi:predicted nucleic acid-binding protein
VYLVDTNVISEAAPSRLAARRELVDWMDRHSTSLYLSVVTVTEIEAGISRARREQAARKAANLTAWLETVLHLYGDRVLAFDTETARVAGALSDRARSRGRPAGMADVIIAATAKYRAFTVLTRNLRHFSPLGVAAVDPFAALP